MAGPHDLHAVLNDLEREGFIARVRDDADRRRNLVQLTPAGTDELVRWDVRVEAAQDALLAPLSAAERRDAGVAARARRRTSPRLTTTFARTRFEAHRDLGNTSVGT